MPTSLPCSYRGCRILWGPSGAISRSRAPLTDRRALFDIGVAGPLAGFVIAVIALVVGLRLSTVVPIQTSYGMHLGEPLLLQFASWIVIGAVVAERRCDSPSHRFCCLVRPLHLRRSISRRSDNWTGHVAYALLRAAT